MTPDEWLFFAEQILADRVKEMMLTADPSVAPIYAASVRHWQEQVEYAKGKIDELERTPVESRE